MNNKISQFFSTWLLFFATTISGCADQIVVKQHSPEQKILANHLNKGFDIHGLFEFIDSGNKNDWLHEFSGLGWDYDEQILYAVTDGAYLLALQVVFSNNKLTTINILSHHKLLDQQGNALTGKNSDSEGLALLNHNNKIVGDTELLVSFERHPRIVRYSTTGKLIGQVKIPLLMTKAASYQGNNKQIEAITEHSQYQFIFGSERPLLSDKPGKIRLFSKQKQIAELMLDNPENGSLVGLTTLPNGNLLALERVFINIFSGLRFKLHYLQKTGNTFSQKILTSINPGDGLLNDNMEGITHHKENYFFMVTDDNESAIQRNLLIYFRLPELAQESLF